MTDALGCRRRSLPRYLLQSNQASPPPSPSGSTSSRSSGSSTSPRCSPTSSSLSRIGNNHHRRRRRRNLPPIPSSVSLRHRLHNIFSARTIRRLTLTVYNSMYGMASSQRLEGISRLCAVYSFTGILFTAYVGTMIKIQPIYIKGISVSNQEITKESAFGAMGMFIFLFALSIVYLCFRKYRREYDDHDENAIRARGYMRPLNLQSRSSNGGVELPNSGISEIHSDSEEEYEVENDEMNGGDNEFDTVVS